MIDEPLNTNFTEFRRNTSGLDLASLPQVPSRSSYNWPLFDDQKDAKRLYKPNLGGFEAPIPLNRSSSMANLPTYEKNDVFDHSFPSPEITSHRHIHLPECGDSDIHKNEQEIPHIPVCRYFLQGYCSRGDRCHFAHVVNVPVNGARNYNHSLAPNQASQYHGIAAGHTALFNPMMPAMYHGQPYAYNLVKLNKFHAAIAKKKLADEDAFRFLNIKMEDLVGQILNLCKDQHGCRFLQKKLEEDNDATVAMVFGEVFFNFTELMIGIIF